MTIYLFNSESECSKPHLHFPDMFVGACTQGSLKSSYFKDAGECRPSYPHCEGSVFNRNANQSVCMWESGGLGVHRWVKSVCKMNQEPR